MPEASVPGGNGPGGVFTFYIGYSDPPPADEAAAIISAIDTAFTDFAESRGHTGLKLEITDLRVASLHGVMRIVRTIADIGGAIQAADMAADHNELIVQFLQGAAICVQIAQDAGTADLVRDQVRFATVRMVELLARIVASGRAARATLHAEGEDRPAVVIANDNALAVLSLSQKASSTREREAPRTLSADEPMIADQAGNMIRMESAGASEHEETEAKVPKLVPGKVGLASGYRYPGDGAAMPISKSSGLHLVDRIDGAATRFTDQGELTATYGQWQFISPDPSVRPIPLVDADAIGRHLDLSRQYRAYGRIGRNGPRAVDFSAQLLRDDGLNDERFRMVKEYGLAVVDAQLDQTVVANHHPGWPNRIVVIGQSRDPKTSRLHGIDLAKEVVRRFPVLRRWLNEREGSIGASNTISVPIDEI